MKYKTQGKKNKAIDDKAGATGGGRKVSISSKMKVTRHHTNETDEAIVLSINIKFKVT